MSKDNNNLSEYIRSKLSRASIEAHSKHTYIGTINNFEKYRKQYQFDENLNYKLGQLYDHAAFFELKNPRQKKLRQQYLKKAEDIYHIILHKNPRSVFALHGLGLVYDGRGNHKKALRYAKKSYYYWKKIPKKGKGVLGFGNSYLLMGNIKRAEYWFKKELEELGQKNLGAQTNLLIFYNSAENSKKAYQQALITEKLLKREFNKPFRKRIIGGVNDKTVIFIKKQIEMAKSNRNRPSKEYKGAVTAH